MSSLLEFFQDQIARIKEQLKSTPHATGPKKPTLSQTEKG